MPRSLHMLPLLFTVILVASVAEPVSASSGAAETLARILDGLPADRIETGILYDRVLPLSGIETHDGSAASIPTGLSEWRQVYHEVSRASLRPPAWPAFPELRERHRASLKAGVVPVVVMNVRYERIRPGALETGALVREGGRIAIGEGDPFDRRRVVAAAPLRERTYRGRDVTFRLGREDYFTNDPAALAGIEADFDDGRGPVAVPFDAPWTVRYDRPGRRTIRLHLRFAGAPGLDAAFPFEVVALDTPVPDDTLHLTASIPYLGEFGSGDAYVYLSDAHTSLTNPVIVPEGFDLKNGMDWDELYALLNQEALIETMRAQGFDAVVLDFTDATDAIQKNAFVLVELIGQVNAAIGPGRSTALVGPSMGGLAARYALAYLENANVDHGVRTFVSFDAPQRGADIPLGIQYWLAFFEDDSEEAAALLASLDSPAARQLLVYHHTDPPGATGESDPLRAAFLADLAAVGDYPAAPRRVAVANGSGTGVGQGFNPGDQLIEWEYNSFLVDIIGNVWAVPDGGSRSIFHGLIDFILFPADDVEVVVGGTDPYDNAPGGWRASMAQMDTTEAPYGDIVALHDHHCFIPTVSALDIETEDLFHDVAGDPDLLSRTPFDAVYFPQMNEEHVLITAQSAAWLMAEIGNGVTGVEDSRRETEPASAIFAPTPNPFSGSASIRFVVPASGPVHLAAYDAAGRRVAVIVDRDLEAGEHRVVWERSGGSGTRLASGIYVLAMRGRGFSASRKVLVK